MLDDPRARAAPAAARPQARRSCGSGRSSTPSATSSPAAATCSTAFPGFHDATRHDILRDVYDRLVARLQPGRQRPRPRLQRARPLRLRGLQPAQRDHEGADDRRDVLPAADVRHRASSARTSAGWSGTSRRARRSSCSASASRVAIVVGARDLVHPRRATSRSARLARRRTAADPPRTVVFAAVPSARREEPHPIMAVDLSQIAHVSTEPGELPETMAAWVIRQEREGEPIDAFQLEEIEVPEPQAFEVIVRVMAAGVNFNNVWAALGKPVSVFGYGDHPEYGHHIGGSDASGVVWKVGPGVTRWKPGDEVVVHCNQTSYEDPGGPRPRPDGRALAEDLGLRDDLGLVRPVHEGPGAAAAAQARGAVLGGVGLLRADVLHRLPDADGPRQAAGRRPRADLGRRRRPGRVRDPAREGRGRRERRRRLVRARRASSSSSSAPSTTSTATSSPG